MQFVETPYGDKFIYHKLTMVRTKTTPRRVTPSPKYTYTGTRRMMRARAASRQSASARRALDFGMPVQTVGWPRTTTSRWSQKQVGRIGFTPGSVTGFRRVTVDKWVTAVSAPTSKTLLSEDVTAIPRKTANEINARERDMINCSGFTLRFYLSNTAPALSAAVRVALVSPTDKNEMNAVEFFRGYGDSRAQDFSAALDASQLLHNPINRDNYVVLWEKQFLLGPDNVAGGGENVTRTIDNFQTFSTFVRLNRQLRYDGDSANECSDKIFLVMWYDTPNGEGTTIASDYVTYKRYVITHWKDPGM